jgi:MerR family transcriptional regulator, heat shock protein HspR
VTPGKAQGGNRKGSCAVMPWQQFPRNEQMTTREKYYTIREVAGMFGISEYTVCRIEAEGLLESRRLQDGRKVFSSGDLERIRIVLALSRELGVNWAGIEVILHMRERMLEMQEQIEEIFEHLHRRMEERHGGPGENNRPLVRSKMDIIKILDHRGDPKNKEDS